MESFMLVAATAFLMVASVTAAPFNATLLEKVAKSAEICKLATANYYKSGDRIEDVYDIDQYCTCDSSNTMRDIYARSEVVDCVWKLVSANDGQVCNPDKMTLWETYTQYCNQCNGKMSTATASSKDSSGKLSYYTVDRVCTHVGYISPTPTPKLCQYETYSNKWSDETVSTIVHQCDCGSNHKRIYTRYSYSLETCAKKCISKMDGSSCTMLKMPFHSYYDHCCTSCGGEHWDIDVSLPSSDRPEVARVCVVPLAATPSPSTTPRALKCKYNTMIEKSNYLSTKEIQQRCHCDRYVDTRSSSWMETDPEIFTCYHNCLLRREGLTCNPFQFSRNYAEDCCSKCDGTEVERKLINRYSGGEFKRDVCVPISKIMAIPSPSPLACWLETTASTDYFSLPIVYSTCECNRESDYRGMVTEKSIAKCVRDCVASKDGTSCDMEYSTWYNLQDCCSKCDGIEERRNVAYVAPNTGRYETTVCTDLSPDLNYDPVRDSYNIAFDNDPMENLEISRHVVSAALASELSGGFNSTVTAEFYIDEDDEETIHEEVSEESKIVSRIQHASNVPEHVLRKSSYHLGSTIPKPTQNIRTVSRSGKQKRRACKANKSCTMKLSVKAQSKQSGKQTGKSEKDAVNKAATHWKQKGINEKVFDRKSQKEQKSKYDGATQQYQIKAKLDPKYVNSKLW